MTRNEQALPVEHALKACPFCGGEATLEPKNWCGRDYVGVFCVECNLFMDCRAPNEERAITAWNTRPAVSAEAGSKTWVDCPICGEDGMPRVTEQDGDGGYITCCNLNCGSNGGDNFNALSQPASGGVARGAVVSAEYHLSEGLDAALPSDERGWLLRSRFEAARDLLRAALAAPGQDEGS